MQTVGVVVGTGVGVVVAVGLVVVGVDVGVVVGVDPVFVDSPEESSVRLVD